MHHGWRSLRALVLLAALLGWSAVATAQTVLKCSGTPQAVSGSGWFVRPFKVYVGASDQALVGGYTNFVTASIASGPGGAQISGTVTAQAVSENVPGLGQRSVATFTNIVLSGAGTYTLTFTAPGLSACTTNSFTVGTSWHLGSSSPARGYGQAQPGIVVTDFDGFAVPQSGAIDAGALQFRTLGAPPPPPTCPGGEPPPCITCPGGETPPCNPPPPGTTGPLPPPQNFRLAGTAAAPSSDPTVPAFGALQVSTTNARYMANPAGEIVYLTGAYSWNFASTMPQAELTEYLTYVVAHGYNLLRVPSQDYDGTAQTTNYFSVLTNRVGQAAARGLYVQVSIFPFVDAAPFTSQAFNEAYARALVRAVGSYTNVIFEVGNELTTATLDQGTLGFFVNRIVTVINNEQALQSIVPRRMVTISDFRIDGTYDAHPEVVTFLLNSLADAVGIGFSQRTFQPAWVNPDYSGAKVSIPDCDHISPYQCDHQWAWKIFCMGGNPLLLDGNAFTATFSVPDDPGDSLGATRTYDARSRMGDTRTYALKLTLASVVPHPELSSTGYALAWPGQQYLVYQPNAGSFNVTTVAGDYTVEWFNPTAHTTLTTTTTVSTGVTPFTSPLSATDDAVLLLKRVVP